jgi:hypothetical protein
MYVPPVVGRSVVDRGMAAQIYSLEHLRAITE